MNQQPSFFKIILTDYAAFMSVMVPVFSWAFYLYLLWSGREGVSTSVYPFLFGAFTLIAVACLIWRVLLINSVFADGIEVSAMISKVYFYRDRGRIFFNYTYMGNQYKGSNSVMKWRRTKAMEAGMAMTAIVDSNHPNRAYLRDLFV